MQINKEMIMHSQQENPGDWGQMQGAPGITTATEKLTTAEGYELFLRSWKMDGPDVLLILHGLGGHSGWYIDMGNELASRGISVYAMDHRGFGRSGGLRGHIENYRTFVEHIGYVVTEISKRHPEAGIFLLGHSMGAIFATHFAAKDQQRLAGIVFLNPWVGDTSRVSLGTTLAVLLGGMFKSRRSRQFAGGTEGMTTNAEAIKMLLADSYWQRAQTSSFMFQVLLMRSAIIKQARQITIPALVMQAEEDKAVLLEGSRKLYEALASSDKTWKAYADYDHDSQFEKDRSEMDNDLVAWMREITISPTT
jgi:alpha-beta hydrolase superfamily lysophospholipase